MKKRFLSLVLAIILTLSICIFPSSAETTAVTDGADYQTVFIRVMSAAVLLRMSKL